MLINLLKSEDVCRDIERLINYPRVHQLTIKLEDSTKQNVQQSLMKLFAYHKQQGQFPYAEAKKDRMVFHIRKPRA